MAAHRQSSYVTVTRALLTGGATLALARVFSGASWIAPLLIAAGAAGRDPRRSANARRWNALATVGGTLVVGAWLAILVDDPVARPSLGIPTPSAIAAAGHDLAPAHRTSLRSAVVPVDPVGAALMLAVRRDLRRRARHRVHRAPARSARRRDRPEHRAVRRDVGARFGPLGTDDRGATRSSSSSTSSRCSTPRWRRGAHGSRARATGARSSSVGGAAAGALVVAAAIALGPGAARRARQLGAGSSTGRSAAASGSSILNVTSPLVSVGAKLNGHDSTAEVFTVAHHREERRLLARHRARPVPGRRLGPQLRPAVGDERSRARPARPGTTLVTADVPSRRHRRRLAARRVPPGADRRRPARRCSPTRRRCSSTTRSSGLTYDVQSEVSNPDQSVLESVTVRRPRADVGRRRAARQLLGAGPRLRASRSPTNARDAVRQGARAHERCSTRRRSSTTRRSISGRTRARSTSSCSTRTAASASSTRRRSPSSPVRSGCRPGSRSGTSAARSTADGLWHVEEKDAHAWPEVWLGPNGRLVPLRADARARSIPSPASAAHATRYRVGPTDDHHRRPPRSRPRRPPRRATPKPTPSGSTSQPPARPDAAPRTRATTRSRSLARRSSRSRRRARRPPGRAGVRGVAADAAPAPRSRRPAPRARRVDRGAGTALGGRHRTPAVDDLARVRVAAGPRARRGRGRSRRSWASRGLHTAGDVLARLAVAGRSRRSVVGGRRHHGRAAVARPARPALCARGGASSRVGATGRAAALRATPRTRSAPGREAVDERGRARG